MSHVKPVPVHVPHDMCSSCRLWPWCIYKINKTLQILTSVIMYVNAHFTTCMSVYACITDVSVSDIWSLFSLN